MAWYVTTWCIMGWPGMLRRGASWDGLVCYDVVHHGMAWYVTTWCIMGWPGIVSYTHCMLPIIYYVLISAVDACLIKITTDGEVTSSKPRTP